MTAKALQEILGLDTEEDEEVWEQLKIAKKQPKYFARQSHKDALRQYLILRINNIRHNGRRQSTSNGSQSMGQRTQSARRQTPRHVARNAGPSSSSERRHHASAGGSGSRQTQSPASDNSTIQPRQLNRSARGSTLRGRGGLAPRPIPSHLAGRDVRQTEARTPGETELLDFLTNRAQYRIPHLLPDLVAYGCRNMDDLKKMAEWPHSMIMDTLKELRHRSVTTARPLDWDVLGYALWNLGGRRFFVHSRVLVIIVRHYQLRGFFFGLRFGNGRAARNQNRQQIYRLPRRENVPLSYFGCLSYLVRRTFLTAWRLYCSSDYLQATRSFGLLIPGRGGYTAIQ
ncbi:hypothetical protein BDN72DRAFT_863848 [Pluteus cervinus]|uniref:Uncharacterized protein n=1 Tax=Pluteus cervinus TaxID=181527 RepID=A0ACD3A636_9AGAR|nr:hypothetical protein BDN72DRAFT_863848 [Pluteus cervinus]